MRRTAPRTAAAASALILAALLGSGAASVIAQAQGPGQQPIRCELPRTTGSSGTHGGGALMVPVTLDQVTDDSSLVVVGRVAGFESCTRGTPDSIFTVVTLVPEQVLKGSANGSVRLTVAGGTYGDRGFGVGTSPEFTAGGRVVVFAGPEGSDLVPVQGYQSKLEVAPDGRIPGTPYTLDRLETAIRKATKGPLTAGENFPLGEVTQVSAAYAPWGPYWADNAIPPPFHMNVTSFKPSQLGAQDVRDTIANALHTWQNDPASYIAFGPLAETTRISGEGPCDYINDTTFGISETYPPHLSGTLAITYICYHPVTMAIIDTDIEIDVDHFGSAWRTNGLGGCFDSYYDLETVLLHEYGHALGLDHPSFNGGCGPCPVMDGSYGGVQRTLCADDAEGVTSLYGLTGGAPPAAPANVGASRNGAITVTWNDVTGEMGYEVWRAPVPCASAQDADFTLLDSVPDGVLSYVDNDYGGGLGPATTYCYKLRSFNTDGTSAFSGTVQSDGIPPPPTFGDTDCDADVDAVDALAVLRYVASLPGTPGCIASGDVNCDGTINAVDALLILRHVAAIQPLGAPCP